MAQEAEFEAFGAAGSRSQRGRPIRSIDIESDPGIDQDPFPLFIYGNHEPEPPVFERPWGERVLSSRTFKAAAIVVLAATAMVAMLAWGRVLGAFPADRAPLFGRSSDASSLVLINDSVVGEATALPGARSAPTREVIADAFNSVRQRQITEISQPATVPPPPRPLPPPRQLDPDEMAAMMKRARGLLAIGDIAAARLLLERAADALEPNAAFLLAQTYDPAVLGRPDSRSITPDPVAARNWYKKAAQLGSPDAQQRLAQMKE
jgi:hypothetical protein